MVIIVTQKYVEICYNKSEKKITTDTTEQRVFEGGIMRKVFCIIFCVLLVFSTSSCKKEEVAQNESGTDSQSIISQVATSSQNKTESIEDGSGADAVTSKTSSEASQTKSETKPESRASKESSKTSSAAGISSAAPISSVAAISSSALASSAAQVQSTVQTSFAVKQELSQFTYTVNDAENTRGLSTEKNGFSFGVAKDGKPHSQSVINQQTFDAFQNIQALALDTKSQEKVMYLTFDNGYEYNNLTADILDTLKEKNVKAAFFVTLSYAKQSPQLVKRMIDEGHIVGNHSSTHPSFPTLTRTQMAEEIATLDNYLRKNFSYTSPYFRFPAGEYSECSLELVTSIGFRSVFWSVAYSDWDTSNQKGADNAFSTVTSRFHPGAVILLHAVSQDNAQALGRIIDQAHNEGYKFKTLNDYPF